MRKKMIIMLSVLFTVFLTMGITTLAATCPACEQYDVQAECIQYGQHLWDHTAYHTIDYTENGIKKSEECRINYIEDQVWWVCPNGHGTISTKKHYQELHSSSLCRDLDYYY